MTLAMALLLSHWLQCYAASRGASCTMAMSGCSGAIMSGA
jgi:hypothetical protein